MSRAPQPRDARRPRTPLHRPVSRRGFLGLAGALAAAPVLGSALTGCGGTAAAQDGVVVYAADGLDTWFETQFRAFQDRTGIPVALVEGGSGEVVARAAKEISNPQVDLVVTLPPFIQQAAAHDLLQPHGVDVSDIPAAERDAQGRYVTLMRNTLTMIRSTKPGFRPTTWQDLLDPALEHRLQYSTPGQSGDGTAMYLLLQHLMGRDGATQYVADLRTNNVGPSSSTGKLGPKVSTGELRAANSDLQMALTAIEEDSMAYEPFIPTDGSGKATTIALPYAVGMARNAPRAEQAARLLEFLLSPEVQRDLPTAARGRSARTDVVHTGEQARRIQDALHGVEVWTPDWDDVLTHLDSDLRAYREATAS